MEQKIREAIEREEYDTADSYLQKYLEDQQPYTEMIAILDGSIGAILGNRSRLWNAIRKGLKENPKNDELYVMLGNYFLKQNLQQAYLCYENALFYCNDNQDRESIQNLMNHLVEEYGVNVPKIAIVILSYNLLEYTRQCIESIRENTAEESREIIVIDNASTDGSVEWLKEQKDIQLLCNRENRGFPAGCNQGIRMAKPDSDIFLLNNDTILTPNSLFWLRMGLYENEQVGSTGSVSNYVSNGQQINREWKSVEAILAFARQNNLPQEFPYEEKLFLIGFALLIKRQVVEKIGLLDEVFSPENSEDVDYGLRVLQAGYHNLLCKNSFILHFGSKSFGKLGKGFSEILSKNHAVLNRKWGIALQYYMFPWMELINFIQEERRAELKVLDIGCGCGAGLAKIRSIYPKAEVFGIELVSRAAQLAKTIGHVICKDVETMEFPYPENYFDYCILADVLEHLKEPERVLEQLKRCMKPQGQIIVSMLNVKHWSVFLPLLKQDQFTYEEAGILDRTHLRMYTGKEIQRLIVRTGYKIEEFLYTVMGEPSEADKKVLQKLTKLIDSLSMDSFMAYQYIVRARVVK